MNKITFLSIFISLLLFACGNQHSARHLDITIKGKYWGYGTHIGKGYILTSLHLLDGELSPLANNKPTKIIRKWKSRDLTLIRSDSKTIRSSVSFPFSELDTAHVISGPNGDGEFYKKGALYYGPNGKGFGYLEGTYVETCQKYDSFKEKYAFEEIEHNASVFMPLNKGQSGFPATQQGKLVGVCNTYYPGNKFSVIGLLPVKEIENILK